jgi:hypothetical protein
MRQPRRLLALQGHASLLGRQGLITSCSDARIVVVSIRSSVT